MIDSNIFDFHAELNDESMNVIGNNPNSIIGSYDNTISEDIGQDTITSSMNYGHLAHDISEETGETGLSDSFYESTHKVEISNSNNISSPYDSGFDDEHPIPSYKELRNAGFTDFEAKKIIYGDHEMYSDKELYECLYESADPKASYDAMIKGKTDEMFRKIDERIARL